MPEHYYDGRNITKYYDVRDITVNVTDFTGVTIRLKGSDSGYSHPDICVDWDYDECWDEIDNSNDLEKLIYEQINPKSWYQNVGSSINKVNGMLIIRQTPEIHHEIRKLLSEIRHID